MDKPINEIRAFLKAQVTGIQDSAASNVEFSVAVNNFIEELALEIGDMVGRASSNPVTTFGRFVLLMAAAQNDATNARFDATECDETEAEAPAAAT